ncbi:AraC family transcriptional regulator [uncultured Brevundimonas sp.]|uniref:AraC family transcriptional regulator n=1 Tax=uncultured Brevundimonas sp. TaxID=213418 RepID=UPI00261F98C1|nr:AraC family transcriptional regulator [uncultured Brevundimonas sp.]
MDLSTSSRTASDPLSDVLTALGAGVARLTRLEAAGDWALAFPAAERLKFVAILKGSAWITPAGREPQRMQAGDVCLIGPTDYAVASDPNLPPVDGETLYVDQDTARLGGDETIGIGGVVTLSSGTADFLLNMLPDFLMAPRSAPTSGAVSAILELLSREAERGSIGGQIVGARLADVLLVEAIRAYADGVGGVPTGWLGALADVRLGRALRAVHDDIARPWTVAEMAGTAGMSRAAFSAAFTRGVGQPPLSYVRAWRLTLAHAALTEGETNIARLAARLGYSSQSAFTHAFRSVYRAAPMAVARAG